MILPVYQLCEKSLYKGIFNPIEVEKSFKIVKGTSSNDAIFRLTSISDDYKPNYINDINHFVVAQLEYFKNIEFLKFQFRLVIKPNLPKELEYKPISDEDFFNIYIKDSEVSYYCFLHRDNVSYGSVNTTDRIKAVGQYYPSIASNLQDILNYAKDHKKRLGSHVVDTVNLLISNDYNPYQPFIDKCGLGIPQLPPHIFEIPI
jgi:hypothetical protein